MARGVKAAPHSLRRTALSLNEIDDEYKFTYHPV